MCRLSPMRRDEDETTKKAGTGREKAEKGDLMLTEKEIRDKLFEDYPVMFRQSMSAKNWFRARNVVDTARKVALFLQFPEEDLDELFGLRGDRGEMIKQGRFPEEEIIRCDDEVRKIQYKENREMMQSIRQKYKKDA